MSVAVLSRLPLEVADHAAPAPPDSGRMLQLDGLRGLAVLGVMAWHFLPPYPYLRYAPVGWICVRIFFTLSGFLITGILLRARRQNEEFQGTWWGPVRHFYIRRVMRIFPIYYAVLLVVVLGGVPSARESAAWHALYLSNFVSAASWGGGGSTAHFWSLAVEEQFYLVWPWLIFFVPRRGILWVIMAMFLTGPVYRLVTFLMTENHAAATVIPFGCFDSLAAGALLAWVSEEWKGRREALARVCLVVGLPLFVLALALYNANNVGLAWMVVMDMGVGLTTAWVLSRASVGFGGVVGRTLQWSPLLWLGTISYCVYVIHPFIHNLTPHVWERLQWPGLRLRYLVLINTALTLGLATLSWLYFEKPLIRLGRTWAPDGRGARGVAAVGSSGMAGPSGDAAAQR
jgi:peptidoglycan/LPS O-acetylase OafA/YrhL